MCYRKQYKGDDMGSFVPKRLVPYHVGDRVTQPMLGEGTVTSVDENYTTVEFDKRGPRTMRSDMAALSIISSAASADHHR